MVQKIGLKLGSLAAVLVFQGMVWVDARGLHGCPQHDALPGTEHGHHAQGSATHDGHGAAGDEHGHHAGLASAGHHSSAEGGGHEGPCTCVGDCASGPNVPVAATLDGARFAAIADALEAAPARYVPEQLPGAPSFLLPYAHGPPHAA